ncbi:L-aspartate oxidase [Anaerolineales bacterium HSG24]|nr:L-aspartate oxidase [Anaerolineales bacterium HSG24]
MNNKIETDVLILGSGIAGGTAALQLAESGIQVMLVTRATDPHESNTFYAQGGIIYEGDGDSADLLEKDLLRAGAGHGHPEAVKILAEEGPALVRKILVDKIDVPFERTDTGELVVIREAAHAKSRILHAADITGRAISISLVEQLQRHPNITLLTDHTAIDLLTSTHHSQNRLAIYELPSCVGAYLLNQKTKEVMTCLAKKTVLATGGLGQIYLRTTNPFGSRGDGLAMAYRAGARAINCEFVQFHPTTFHHQNAPHFLISEAVRGEGARLVHADGEPFMQHYNEEWRDLAPRDVVARSIHQEMVKQDVTNVYLDLQSYIPTAKIKNHFPNINQRCQQYGIDITQDLVPVVPGAHYFCGGVWVDGWGRTTVQNLYALGEVSCTGVHGANRLGSASLLEGLVWGDRAARDISANLSEASIRHADDIPPWQNTGLEQVDLVLVWQDMRSIQHIMWNYVGLVRTTTRLRRATRELRHLQIEIEEFYRKTQLTDGLLGLRNAVQASIIVANAAWTNKTSIGCHYRKS